MARIDVDEILNIPDDVIIGGKKFYVREFVLKERLEFAGMLNEQKEYAEKMLKYSPKKLIGKFNTKDIFDFKLLKFIFSVEKQPQEFTEQIFNTMTTSQIKKITDHVFKRNGFFDLAKTKQEAAEEKK